MSDVLTDRDRFTRAFLLLLVLAVAALFFRMIQNFLVAVLLGALTAALVQPFYQRAVVLFRGRCAVAAFVTLLVVLVIVLTPLLLAAGAVASEAAHLARSARTWASAQPDAVSELEAYLERFPVYGWIAEQGHGVVEKLGELTSSLSSFLANSLSAAARGTVGFVFQLFLMLYATFHFLLNGKESLEKWTNTTPLTQKQTRAILDSFASVARATIKGTFVVGIVQGTLIGTAFALAGVPGAFFWGAIMTVLSAVPIVGPSLVYVPAVIYLLAIGKFGPAIGLAVWCTLVVNIAGNILRPRLVGRDTQMPDGLVLLGTLGGISMFGVVGVLIGPMIGALFMALWDLYRSEFQTVLMEPLGQEGHEGPG